MLKMKLTAEHLRGVITALVTPFQRGRIDLGLYADLVENACEAGISGIVPLGTTGESPTLSMKEREALIKQAVRTADGRLTVIVGAGTNNTSSTVAYVDRAHDLGADGVLVVAPYYNKPTPEGLKRHFLRVADESKMPIVLYHIPGRCGVGIPQDLTLELGGHERIIGVKEAAGDVWRSGEIARLAPDNFAVLSGDDPLTLALMSVGAVGAISVISNLAPKTLKRMVDLALAGDFAGARDIHYRLAPLTAALGMETNPGPIKEAMNLSGWKVGQVRPPLAPVRPASKKALKAALREAGKIE